MKKPLLCLFALLFLVITAVPTGRANATETKYRRSIETYNIPDVVLTNQDGKKVRLKELLESGKPVIVEFIFGTCTTICPVLSAGFTNLQSKLGKDTDKVQLVSITIDPENDTPKVMKEYLKRYKAKPGWEFLTGSRSDVTKVMRAFNAYVRNKMFHFPLTLIRMPDSGKWVRINGIMSTSEFIDECGKAGVK